jgi:dipeptidyl aminopeptidase/acylaminoacyl peptidase
MIRPAWHTALVTGLLALLIAGMRGVGARLPEAGQIAFTDDRQAVPDIFLLDVRTRTIANLTKTGDAAEGVLQWSPDGTRLLYHMQALDGRESSEIQEMDMDSLTRRTLARQTASAAWSPEGSQLMVMRGSGYALIAVDGSSAADDGLTSAQPPRWSAQGLQALIGRQPGIAIPGIDLERRTFLFTVTHANWAAGGRWGAFRIDYWEATGLYVLDAACLPDCLGAAQSIPGTEDGRFPAVSPDRRAMTFVCRWMGTQPYLCLLDIGYASRQYLIPLRGMSSASAWRPPR